MGTAMVLTAAYLNLTGPGLVHGAMSKIELTTQVESKDVTTYTDLGWKAVKGGLKSGNVGVTFKQNYAVGQLDELLWAVFGTVIPFEIRSDQGAVTTSNPKWTGNTLIEKLVPVSGSPGDVAEQSLTWPTSGPVLRGTT